MLVQNCPRILCKNCFCDESCPQLLSLPQEKPMMSCTNNKLMYVHARCCGFLLVSVINSTIGVAALASAPVWLLVGL